MQRFQSLALHIIVTYSWKYGLLILENLFFVYDAIIIIHQITLNWGILGMKFKTSLAQDSLHNQEGQQCMHNY